MSPAVSIPAQENCFWRMLLASCPMNILPDILTDPGSSLVASDDLSLTALEKKETS